MSIRKPNVAGVFYPGDKENLTKKIEELTTDLKKDVEYVSRAIIAPHAGFDFSGKTAAKAYQYLNPTAKTVFVFAPVHRHALSGLAVPSDLKFEIPTGKIKVDTTVIADLVSSELAAYNDDVFVNEHSVEVQLPFIKHFLPKASVVPILVGAADFRKVTEIIEKYWDNSTDFVVSSDLTHFRTKFEANRIDNVTADMIENGITLNMLPEQACGYIPVCGLTEFAKQKGFTLARVDLTDSSAASGDKDNVVGYGAWFLAEEEKTDFIKNNFSDLIRNLAYISIKSQLEKANVRIETYPKMLETKLASFVTLEIGENLRGCIGSVLPHEPLIVDICRNARNAAFKDPRFTPVQANEFDKLKITVSLLSAPKKLEFGSEEELLEKLTPDSDGLVIRDVGRQSLFLPDVWKKIPDKREFLNALKQKAGLAPNWFSETFEAFTFKTVYIQ